MANAQKRIFLPGKFYRIVVSSLFIVGSCPLLMLAEQEKSVGGMASEINELLPELNLSVKKGAGELPLNPSLADASLSIGILDPLLYVPITPSKDVTEVFVNLFGDTVKLLEEQVRALYNDLITHNPYKNYTASVRVFKDFTPCPDEQKFMGKRDVHTLAALKNITQMPLDKLTMPRIGIVCSGGGMRAAIGFAGALKELDQKEKDSDSSLLDTISIINTLSGSTWAIVPWLITDKSFRVFAEEFFDRASRAIIGKPLDQQMAALKSFSAIIIDDFTRKIVFGDIPSLIDVYGMLLGLSLFSPEQRKNYLNITLASMAPNLAKGQQPLPIFTAVTPKNNAVGYKWKEFTPYEVATYDDHVGVPSWSFGRYFEKGVSKTRQPSIAAAQFMSMFGSAISLDLMDIFNFVLSEILKGLLFAFIKRVVEVPFIGNIRVFPTFVNNVTYKMTSFPDSTLKKEMVVDGGMSFGIPITPLLYRPIDLIILFDLSANVLDPAPKNELWKAERYARERNLPFPKIDLAKATSNVFSVFDDGPGSEAPIVLYIPMIKNAHFSSTFDPQDHLGKLGFLNTFNFLYTKEQIGLLAGLMGQAVKDVRPTILQLTKTAAERRALKNKVPLAA
ncbi:MAG: hypothetical protein A2Y17_09645 [Clostridiales bacterium GWF2_38_85]|nr:MAG: hypothetical protein A2Y17_09645 [Clostridiales bacterium GWF2_38_85]